jgi:predicted metalloprotease
MKWDRDHRSRDVEDLRGRRVSGGGGGSTALVGIGAFLFRRFGIAGVVIAVVGYLALQYCGGGGILGVSGGGGGNRQPAGPPGEDEPFLFVSFVFDDAQATWKEVFAREGKTYQKAGMRVFSDQADSACGLNSAAVGPFYCPGDHYVYIDLTFYETLKERLGAGGDFAEAYVIAHEVGHHVQNLLGNLDRGRDEGADGGQVRVELQADCYAGVWAHGTAKRDMLEAGDLEEAFTAAKAIGDDTLQKRATGTVQPHKWTHGSSAQRKRWFERGLKEGTLAACDTFSASSL